MKMAKVQKTEQVVKAVYACDRCRYEFDCKVDLRTCILCGRVICYDCSESASEFFYHGGYEEVATCEDCYKVGEPYRDKMAELLEEWRVSAANALDRKPAKIKLVWW